LGQVRDIWLCRSLFEKEVRIQEAEYRISYLLSAQSKGYYSGMTGFGYLVADLIRTPERSDTEFSCFLFPVSCILYSDFSGSFFTIESLIGASQCRALWTRVSTAYRLRLLSLPVRKNAQKDHKGLSGRPLLESECRCRQMYPS
jgi:hypothetical protein